jgi:hypothetical protein
VEQEVEVGLSDGKRTEVLSGVSDGETLLATQFRPGGRNGAAKATNPFMPARRR